MSIKLYNGIKFNSNKLSTVIRQLHSIKEESIKKVQESFENPESRNFLSMCIFYMLCEKNGESFTYEKDGEKIPCYWIFERKLKEKMREPYRSGIGFDCNFSVTIFERKNKLYGVFFDQTNKNYKQLFDKDIAVDYHYQNQTDKPDEISLRDWRFREEVWEDIFDDISVLWIPSEAGVVYDIVTEDDINISKEIFEKVIEKCKELKEKKNEKSDE